MASRTGRRDAFVEEVHGEAADFMALVVEDEQGVRRGAGVSAVDGARIYIRGFGPDPRPDLRLDPSTCPNTPKSHISTSCAPQIRASFSDVRSGGTAKTMRSWASLIQISVYERPAYFSGALSRWTPVPMVAPISPTAEENPPAPQSVMAVKIPRTRTRPRNWDRHSRGLRGSRRAFFSG